MSNNVNNGLIMLGNALIECAWLSATVYLVVSGKTTWAVFTLIGAFVCGYSTKQTRKEEER